MSPHFPAWVLIALSLFIPLASRNIRQRGLRFLLLFWAVIAAHHVVSLLNFYGVAIPGANTDALRFHNLASGYSEPGNSAPFGLGSRFYVLCLSLVYDAFKPSLLLAQTLIISAFTLAIVVFFKIKDSLGFSGGDALSVTVLGMQPFMLLWASINLREAYQILFLLFALYCALRVGRDKRRQYILPLISALTLLGMLHNGLAAYAPILLGLIALWNFHPSTTRKVTISPKRIGKRVAALASVAILGIGLLLVPTTGALNALLSGDAVEYAQEYRAGSAANVGGSAYTQGIDLSSPSGFFSAEFGVKSRIVAFANKW